MFQAAFTVNFNTVIFFHYFLILNPHPSFCRGAKDIPFLLTLYAIFLDLGKQLCKAEDPDQSPQNVASDQGLHCLYVGISVVYRMKIKHTLDTPKTGKGLIQLIRVE